MRTVLTLLLIPAAVAADDPPFVTAAKERQAKAKAFEVTLTVRKEWKGVTPIGSNEWKDFEGTGTAKLAVDGDRYWYEVDVPELIGMKDRVIRRRCEAAFDGRWYFLRIQSEVVNGERAGQMSSTNAIQDVSQQPRWDSTFELIRWVFRGTDAGTLFDDPAERGVQNGLRLTIRPTGQDEVIDGKRCVEIERVTVGPYNTSKQSFWLDAADHLLVRVEGTTIQYRQHPVLGRVPSRWTNIPTSARGPSATRTTVTVDSFELRDSTPDERFTIKFPVGSRVTRFIGNRDEELVVAEDGSLVPVVKEPPPAPVPTPEPPTRSLQHTLWVVGGVVTVFVALVVLLRRLARNRTDDSPDSGSTPPLLT